MVKISSEPLTKNPYPAKDKQDVMKEDPNHCLNQWYAKVSNHLYKIVALLLANRFCFVTYTYCSYVLKANKALHHQMSNETNKGVLIPGGNDLIIERSHVNMKCHKPFNFTGLFHLLFTKEIWYRTDSRLGPNQWETSLQSNAISHWLGAELESALWYMCSPKCQCCKCHRTGGVSQHMVGSPTVFQVILFSRMKMFFIPSYSLCHKWYNFL